MCSSFNILRSWHISIITQVAAFGIVVINRPLTAFVNLLQYTDSIYAKACYSFTWAIGYYTIIFGLAFRLWFLHYQTRFSITIEGKQWKTIINKTDWGDNWYLQNVGRYGNERWMGRRVLCVFLLVVCHHCTYVTQCALYITSHSPELPTYTSRIYISCIFGKYEYRRSIFQICTTLQVVLHVATYVLTSNAISQACM